MRDFWIRNGILVDKREDTRLQPHEIVDTMTGDGMPVWYDDPELWTPERDR